MNQSISDDEVVSHCKEIAKSLALHLCDELLKLNNKINIPPEWVDNLPLAIISIFLERMVTSQRTAILTFNKKDISSESLLKIITQESLNLIQIVEKNQNKKGAH